jgi:predicted ATPase/DNA-binding SARP family transcriptional activator
VEFRALGPLEVIDAGRPVALGGSKQRTVLARLLLHANQAVTSESLVEAVWGENPPGRARATLQVYVANLRRLLDKDVGRPRLIRHASGYLLRTTAHEFDVDRFHGLIEGGRAALAVGDPMRASLLLRAALELWRGPPFPDLADCGASIAEVARLDEQRLNALEDRIEADLQAGRAEQVVTELAALVGTYPLRERLHAQRILALYRTGRQAEALAAYQSARATLRDELGMDPSAPLRQLERAVLHQDPSLDAPAAPEPVRPPLPVSTTRLIGREREVTALTALLSDPSVRLITLLGPGGTGKSRLGLELATALQADFADGVFYVPLAPLTDPLLVLPAIASTLGVRETAQRALHEILASRLKDDRALLVLDNFEQLLPAANHIAELLSATRHLKVLVTSRAPLRIRGEYEYPVEPLTLPMLAPPPALNELLDNPAVRLFVDRARAVAPDFEPDEIETVAVAAICHRLDGLPLAIELAAARSRVLSPQAILTRLDARLRLLIGGPRDVPTQQQTIRGSIEWSYELLEPEEQDLFARLAVFQGGCDLDAVEAVCTPKDGDPLDVLDRVDSLVSQSLLQRRRAPNGTLRFVTLETIHEFAKELLDGLPDDSVQRQHAEFFAALAETAEPWLTGGEQLEWLARLSREHDNLRAALAWSSGPDGDSRIALRLAAALWHFWEMSGSFAEGRRWLEIVLAGGDMTVPELRLRAISGAATMAWSVGDHDRATQLHQDALQLATELGDASAQAFSLNALGAQMMDVDYDKAEELFDQARVLAMKLGELRTGGMARHNIAEIELHRGRYAQAAEGYEDSLRIFSELGDQWLVVASLHGLAVAVLRQGDRERAANALRDGLRLAFEVGENFWLAENLEGLAAVAEYSNQPTRAARLLGAADAMRRRIGAPLQQAEQSDYESLLHVLRAKLGDDALNDAWDGGQQLTVKQFVEEASQI